MGLPFTPRMDPPIDTETFDKEWEGCDDPHPWKYIPEPGLVNAANVALLLDKPLLITGEPGTGKTSFACQLAYACGFGPPLKFETKSNSVAKDLFYTFDAMSLFKAAYLNERKASAADFITYQALGKAIIMVAEVQHPIPKIGPTFEEKKVPLILIDEVDKAPTDFTNDILNEIESMYFKVPELNQAGADPVEVRALRKPVTILTSNSEKQLPDAFLRRCIYYDLSFPTAKGKKGKPSPLEEIITNRIGESLKGKSQLLQNCLEFFEWLRTKVTKKPATAELLDWIAALQKLDLMTSDILMEEHLENTWVTLLKNSADRGKRTDLWNEWEEKQKG